MTEAFNKSYERKQPVGVCALPTTVNIITYVCVAFVKISWNKAENIDFNGACLCIRRKSPRRILPLKLSLRGNDPSEGWELRFFLSQVQLWLSAYLPQFLIRVLRPYRDSRQFHRWSHQNRSRRRLPHLYLNLKSQCTVLSHFQAVRCLEYVQSLNENLRIIQSIIRFLENPNCLNNW